MVKEYTDDELIAELTAAIEELGGKIIMLDKSKKLFRIDIDDEFRDYATVLANDLSDKYKLKRAELLTKNPFIGTQQLVDEMKKLKE